MSVLDLLGDEINNVDGEEEQEGVSNTLGEQASTNIISTATASATSSSTITQHQTSSSSITIQEPTTSTQKPVSTATNSKPWGKLVLVSTGCSDIPKEFFLTEDLITIGRMQTNNVRIFSKQQSKFVSRNHAQIKKINAFTFEIEDKGSMNGTLVNGKKIQSSRLKHGDLIIITGGPTANFNDYITVNDKKREMFQSEQDWKYELTTQLKQAFIYRFELLDQNAIMKSLSTAITEQTSILSKEEKSVENLSRDISVTQAQKPLVPDNKRKIDDTDLSTTSETGKKFKALSECCTSELTCCICYNLYVEPTVLECGHNFCKRCLYEWLAKNHSCPLCRKKLSKGSYPNRGLETILNTYVQHVSCADEQKLREDRIRLIQQKFDEDLAKLHGMIENAKAKKIKFLNIKDRWKLEEKRTFKNGVKQYFGKCREDFCNLVGMTENFVNNCTNEELIIACDNLEIPVAYMIVGQEIKTMRRVVDFDQTRQRLLNFWNASDNLFFI